ncbi:MAG: hypothetical protein A3F13_05030 [Gammaproteobacteria bacterium RIFCSPHIGHO2_12_FULL_40_19]|nr:MAG: hypothetical protein A3F13_05030 [Gammaproteobacteria bacterium RIFCSPHIGHO2_12_FULL_40_19]
MKMILGALLVLLLLLQYEFWFSDGGMKTVWEMQKNISKQEKMNAQLDKRNQVLIAEIKDLQSGNAAIEARARNDLGMVKKDEIFYEVIRSRDQSA